MVVSHGMHSHRYTEDVYVRRDPFSTDPRPLPLAVAGECSLCHRTVCIGGHCSLFYAKRFCTECVQRHVDDFPPELKRVPSPCSPVTQDVVLMGCGVMWRRRSHS